VQPLGRASPFHAPFVISQQTGSGRMKFNPGYCADAGKLDAVEQLVALAQEAGLSLTHPAMAFAIAHPGVTSARARWNSSTMCSRAPRLRSATRSWTESTRSWRLGPTSDHCTIRSDEYVWVDEWFICHVQAIT